MKNFLILFFGLFVSICFSQNTYELKEFELEELKRGLNYVQKYADSLNNFECDRCKVLPDFFYEHDFDRKSGYKISTALHSSVSIRKLIIDKIDNEPLLNAVLRAKDKRLRKRTKLPRKHYMGYVPIPFQEYSMLELVKYRLQELMNEKNMGKRASNYPN